MSPLVRRCTIALLLAILLAAAACTEKPARPVVSGPAPDSFRVDFETSRGNFVVAVNRAWAPNGADRFYQLAASGFFDDQRFFRVLSGYIAQFGASGDPKTNELWEGKKIPDDPRRESNARGTISFASDGPGSRTHQLFVNLKNNPKLDAQDFVPIGRVVEGMSMLDSLNDDYGESPKYHLIATLGNSYLRRMFPRLDYIKTAKIVGDSATAR
ncbi:MAG: peptidyl-prolyl cis-trans isomerase PpiA precursor [Gemmatimonadetes bacterium]|nr:peptidyl-prolyl cis-trans isomerase PpiA precursor [Gemmatimonadota bacterium]